MKYIINNTIFSNQPIYKDYKLFSQLNEAEKEFIDKTVDRYSIFYYLIENNTVTHYTRNLNERQLADNCRIATQKEIEKFELVELKEKTITSLLENYKQSKANAKLLAGDIELNFAKDIDDAISELNIRVSGGSIAGLEMLQNIDNLKHLLNKAIEIRHELRSNVATEQNNVNEITTLAKMKSYKPTLKVVFDDKIDILELLKWMI